MSAEFDEYEQLPTILALKWRQFLREEERWSQGVASSNFAFQVASLNGLTVRFLVSLLLGEFQLYKESCNSEMEGLVASYLENPTDGLWVRLVDTITSGLSQVPEATMATNIRKMLKKKVRFEWGRMSIRTVLQRQVQFRNVLLHGVQQLYSPDFQRVLLRTKALYKHLHVLTIGSLVACDGRDNWTIKGLDKPVICDSLSKSNIDCMAQQYVECLGAKDEKSDSRYSTWLPYWHIPTESKVIPLWPILHCQFEPDTQQLTEYFFNGRAGVRCEYMSYRSPTLKYQNTLFIPDDSLKTYWESFAPLQPKGSYQQDLEGLVDYYKKVFAGREVESQEILNFCMQHAGKIGTVKSQPGKGKTALFVHLYQIWKEKRNWPNQLIPVWHFCSQKDGWEHPVFFLQSLIQQMNDWLGVDTAILPQSLSLLKQRSDETWKQLVSFCYPKKVVLFVDALDESSHVGPSDSIASVFPIPLSQVDSESVVIVSYRVDESGVNIDLERRLREKSEKVLSCFETGLLEGLSKQDMNSYLQDVVLQESVSLRVASSLWELTQGGDPFTFRIILELAKRRRLDLARVETIPQSLDEAYDEIWMDLPTHQDYLLHRLLGFLSIVPELFTDHVIAKLFSMEESDKGIESGIVTSYHIAEARGDINRYLLFQGDSYRIFHHQLRDFILRQFHDDDVKRFLLQPLVAYCSEPSNDAQQESFQLKWTISVLCEAVMHPSYTNTEKDVLRAHLWTLVWDDKYWELKLNVCGRLEYLQSDWKNLFLTLRPDKNSEVKPWSQLGKTFHLAKRSHFVMTQLAMKVQKTFYGAVLEGNYDAVVPCIEHAPSPYFSEWYARIGEHYKGAPMQPGLALDARSSVLSEEELVFWGEKREN